jgi:hypothetical protein
MSFLIAFVGELAAWVAAFLVDLPLYILSLLLTGLAAMVNFIPAPTFVASATGWIGSLPPMVFYIMSSLQISNGLTIVFTAYVLRFLIRRLPFIG